jgi:hypothetical protein
MKKETLFIMLMTLLGAVLGLEIAYILGSIMRPDYTQFVLTFREKAEFEESHRFLGFITGPNGQNIMMAVLWTLAIAAAVLFITILNPQIKQAFRHRTGRLKLAAVLIANLGFWYLFIPAMTDFPLGTGALTSFPGILQFAAAAVAAGLMWLVAGETGWAGDFSSWKAGVADRRPLLLRSFLLGGAVGGAAYGLHSLGRWAFEKFFSLTTEVLASSGNISALTIYSSMYEMIFLLSMSLAVLAGVAAALAPVYREAAERRRRLVFPAVLFSVLAAAVAGGYSYGAVRYDLGKKNFAEAVGVSEKASEVRTIVLFTTKAKSGAALQEWPLEATSTGIAVSGGMALSPENLNKVEEYLARNPGVTIYTNVARQMLVDGHYRLWDPQKGREKQFQVKEEMSLPRFQLLSLLRAVPVTRENVRYLRAFTDEKVWHVGRRSAMRMAEAFMHFGLRNEAKVWMQKAKKMGLEIPETFKQALTEPSITTGRISGSLLVNGKPLRNAKAGLLRAWDYPFEKLDTSTMATRLLDVRTLDEEGRFSFDHLGTGEYMLAFMTGQESIPSTVTPDRLTVKNVPGVIRLGKGIADRNLGAIEVVVQ